MTELTPAYVARSRLRPRANHVVPQPPQSEIVSKEELERIERQLIPAINSIRAALGKPPIIVPKE